MRGRLTVLIALFVVTFAGAALVGDLSPRRSAPERVTHAAPSPPSDEALLAAAARDPDAHQSEAPEIRTRSEGDPCEPIHFGFYGKPKGFDADRLGTYEVPEGRGWEITNMMLMAERHSGGPHAVAGEFTVHMGGVDEAGMFTIGVASLDNGSGMDMAQGRTSVKLAPGTELWFELWLRPGTEPQNYYYTIGASGTDCPLRIS